MTKKLTKKERKLNRQDFRSTNHQKSTIKTWGADVEIERRRRINVSVWAYAYEFENDSIVKDRVFDEEANLIETLMDTGKPHLDDFFAKKFDPCTGMWIRNHPELDKIKHIYNKFYAL